MNIREVKIENFGKLNNSHCRFGREINVVYAPNEGGKSTFHEFVRGMFFGMPRMRGRAARNDLYSRYEPWENPGTYGGMVRMECGAKQFRLRRNFSKEHEMAELVCETDGERLSVADGDLNVLLGEISEAVYDNTVSIGQLKGMTDQKLILELRNYISGCQEGMDAGLDLKKARESLHSQKKEFLRQIDAEYTKKEKEQKRLEEKIQEHQMAERQMRREWNEINQKSSELQKDAVYPKNPESRKLLIGFAVVWILLLAVGMLASFPLGVMGLLLLLGVVVEGVIAGYGQVRESKRGEQNRRKMEDKIQEEKMRWKLESLMERIQEEESLLENLKTEWREIDREKTKSHPLLEEVQALELAEQTILDLSGQMQKKVSRKLQERVSQIFYEMTEGKYRQIELDEQMCLGVHTEERYIPAERLSRGTLEQIYFAFRMAVSEILCQEESLPVILDEAFVLYDNRRLEQTLRWLAQWGHQVILCTCHMREIEILRKMGIPFQEISL